MEPGRHRRAERVAAASLGVTVVLAALKFAVWAATSSLAVLAQALDSVLDIAALGLVLFGVRLAAKPADREHQYGHGKAEHLAAFAQTLLIGVVVIGVSIEASVRLGSDSSTVEAPWYALALLALSVLIDAGRSFVMVRTARAEDSDALRAGALNIAGDVGTAVVALVSLSLVRAGAEWADATGALLVAAAVAIFATIIGKRSVDVLMDRAPEMSAQEIANAALRFPGVKEIRRVRVRRSGDKLFADVTVAAGRTASLERAHDISDGVEREIQKIAPGTDVVVHVEPISETGGLVETVQAAAGRIEGVHEIHNVMVHAFDEGGVQKLHVTLHAKVKPGASLRQAHDLSERIEAAIEAELGHEARVDTHIEPLGSTAFGRDVTADRPDIVTEVRAAATAEPDILDCHEVIVTSTGGGVDVVAHVRGRSDLPLNRMHDAATRVETSLHASNDQIASILLHFEPD